jgi:hypothetical protein
MELLATIIDGIIAEIPMAFVETTGCAAISATPLVTLSCCPELALTKIPVIVGGSLIFTVFPLVCCALATIKGTLGGIAGFITNQFTNVFCGK